MLGNVHRLHGSELIVVSLSSSILFLITTNEDNLFGSIGIGTGTVTGD